jgi:hypothetical protein
MARNPLAFHMAKAEKAKPKPKPSKKTRDGRAIPRGRPEAWPCESEEAFDRACEKIVPPKAGA